MNLKGLQLMQNKAAYIPVNSFSRRPCANQIISYIVIVSENVAFWALIQNNYTNQQSRYAFIGLFAASTLLLVVVALVASASDPSDPVMIQYKNGNSSAVANVGSPCLFCEHCESYVLASSRHCKVCDRCVERFDHHCVWINNCIGKSNYCLFMAMILIVFTNMVIFLASVGLLWAEGRWKEYLVPMVISWFVATPVFIFAVLILALIILHFFLIYQNITTFDYIINKRNAQIAPIPLPTISNHYFSEQNQQNLSNDPQLQMKRESESQSQQHENNRTQNENQYPPPPISAFQNIQNQQRSDFQSFGHIKSTNNKLPSQRQTQNLVISQNRSDLNEEIQVQNFNNFYKKHRGLKVLVGPAILVRPKRSESLKPIKRSQSNKSNLSKYTEEVQIDRIQAISQNADNDTVKTEQEA